MSDETPETIGNGFSWPQAIHCQKLCIIRGGTGGQVKLNAKAEEMAEENRYESLFWGGIIANNNNSIIIRSPV